MSTRVIILAQGSQKRMGTACGFKQLLPLPHCDGIGILERTLVQLERYICADGARVVVVGWGLLLERLMLPRSGVGCCSLGDPGNSSLKGIARYLDGFGQIQTDTSTVVLLGDVVYSWACLDAVFAASQRVGFVGTSDLRNDGGELWGIGWSTAHHDRMMADLRDALLRHPPFEEEYQPGQLRRWITGWSRGDLRDHVRRRRNACEYFNIDDYTMDVDTPAHIPQLAAASAFAAEDDALHGIEWTSRAAKDPTDK